MSIRIYNTAPGGGGGGAGTLQQVLNAGHVATVAGGGDLIQLEDASGNANSMSGSANVIAGTTEFTEQSISVFLAQLTPSNASGGLGAQSLTFTDASGDTFKIDFSTGTPIITYGLIGGDFIALRFSAPTAPNITQVFKAASGNISLDNNINPQTGTTYTFIISDGFNTVTGTNAATQTFTIPPNASVAFPVGCFINIFALGAGKITLSPGAGVTLSSAGSLFSTSQNVGCSIMQMSANNWVLFGNLIA